MKISESWLREWVDPELDTEGLAHRLTMLGLEVDGVEPVAEVVDGIRAPKRGSPVDLPR
jgi:phenylalanyl-tRNA synthetase beta chain